MTESVASASFSQYEVRIVYMAEAEEWAVYLQNVLRTSQRISEKCVVLHELQGCTALPENEQQLVRASSCVVLLMSATLLDLEENSDALKTYQKVFYPPNKMVLFFCGVCESDMPEECFQDWRMWRKLYVEDDPAVYTSTVLNSISYVEVSETGVAEKGTEPDVTTKTLTGDPHPPELPPETELPQQDCMIGLEIKIQPAASIHSLTIQPNRIHCGSQENIFIILTCKMDCQTKAEVEFSCNDCIPKREPGKFENEYTVSVKCPEMPPGTVLVSLYCNDSVLCSRPVTYFTGMGEISGYLENVTNPLDFMCQAFNITSNRKEALDILLTDSLKSQIPTSGLHVFGVSQVEEENMSAYQRNEELPTLLHFAAKFGLKKLASLLLQCPGAMQAYSVVNQYGDYPNNIAEKNGFTDLRQFMDEYVTADMMKSHMQETFTQEDGEVYECMSTASRDILMKYSLNLGCKEDIYESMMELDPDCMEDLYEDMEKALHPSLSSEDAVLRRFFEGKADKCSAVDDEQQEKEEEEEEERERENPESWEEEDPYNTCFPDQIYDTVDEQTTYVPEIVNRPPAPIPRPSVTTEPDDNKTYISRVFSEKPSLGRQHTLRLGGPVTARPVRDGLSTTTYDPYVGMRTPGQRQLITLQERVKVAAITVDEAVQEFKAWQLDQERRSQSLRYQQENLKKLRASITRRQKVRGKSGNDLEITGPLPRRDMALGLECCVYEPMPHVAALPPAPNPPTEAIRRGSWQNASNSSTSSNGSNRHSTLSYSSGADGDFENVVDLPLPPLPARHAEPPPVLPPPRIPPRTPERTPENPVVDRYVHNLSPALPQRAPQRAVSPPPIPRRAR